MNRVERTSFLTSLSPLCWAILLSLGLAIRRNSVDVGSAAEWAGAVGTFAAVVVALWIAIGDSHRRDAERKEEQAAQARLVTIHTHEDVLGGVLHVVVTNHSTAPVFAICVDAIHVTPDPLRVMFKGERAWDRIDPGQSRTSNCLLFKPDGTTVATIQAPSVAAADVSFVDSAGLRWRRWGNTPPRGGAAVGKREPPQPLAEVYQPADG